MNNTQEHKKFTVKFADNSVWKDFKEDLKTTLQDNEIKFQYSEKSPFFFILYKGNDISIRVVWEEERLLFVLQAADSISSEHVDACREIYDLLTLFSGELIEGSSPYDW
ncbi:MAG: hypothetical protein JSV04_13685 [Candidatus Heimdallarchaeota archaeon]|nr:MAG: hypothetical protein JSV04_13685 [Candidatus Heimdallarchaeota archaeon]